jgi:hypothetical protein
MDVLLVQAALLSAMGRSLRAKEHQQPHKSAATPGSSTGDPTPTLTIVNGPAGKGMEANDPSWLRSSLKLRPGVTCLWPATLESLSLPQVGFPPTDTSAGSGSGSASAAHGKESRAVGGGSAAAPSNQLALLVFKVHVCFNWAPLEPCPLLASSRKQ